MALLKVLDELKAQNDVIMAKLDQVLAILAPALVDPPEVPTEQLATTYAASIDYDTYTAAEVLERLPSLNLQQLTLLQIYETANQARKGVLSALEKALAKA